MTDAKKYTQAQLRFALAVNRGIAMLTPNHKKNEWLNKSFGALFTPTDQHTTSADELLYTIHKQLFQDVRHATEVTVEDAEKRAEVRNILTALLYNKTSGLIDQNNFVVGHSDINTSLAAFHKEMQQLQPFAYGNRFTTEFFLTALFEQNAFREVYPAGIDFRRLTEDEKQVLRNPDSEIETLADVFRNAMDASKTPSLENPRDGFGAWPNQRILLSGIPFLSHEKDGNTYIVTVNGGLIPKADAEKAVTELVAKNGVIADLPFFEATEFLPATEGLRQKPSIDGIAIDPENSRHC